MKLEKNFYRDLLKQLIKDTEGRAIIVSAKYKHTNNLKWVTFTTVRPFIPDTRTSTLCNHINVERSSINTRLNLGEELHNRKFYIIGYPFIYLHYGVERGGLRLADDLGIPPIVFNQDFYKIKENAINRCFEFDTNKYARGIEEKQSEI